MNAFADALERAGIETSDFEDVEVDEEAIEREEHQLKNSICLPPSTDLHQKNTLIFTLT